MRRLRGCRRSDRQENSFSIPRQPADQGGGAVAVDRVEVGFLPVFPGKMVEMGLTATRVLTVRQELLSCRSTTKRKHT
jgi:hypothetical protein